MTPDQKPPPRTMSNEISREAIEKCIAIVRQARPQDSSLTILAEAQLAAIDHSQSTAAMRDELERVKAELRTGHEIHNAAMWDLRRTTDQLAAQSAKMAELEQRVCDFQAAAMIDVGGMNGPCCVEPRHVERHVTELRNQIAALEAQAGAMREALELCKPWKDDCPIHKHDCHCCPPDCKFNAALSSQAGRDLLKRVQALEADKARLKVAAKCLLEIEDHNCLDYETEKTIEHDQPCPMCCAAKEMHAALSQAQREGGKPHA